MRIELVLYAGEERGVPFAGHLITDSFDEDFERQVRKLPALKAQRWTFTTLDRPKDVTVALTEHFTLSRATRRHSWGVETHFDTYRARRSDPEPEIPEIVKSLLRKFIMERVKVCTFKDASR